MDGSSISFFWDSSLKEREGLNGIDVGSSCFTNTTLSLNSHSIVTGCPKLYEGESGKRKTNDDDEIFNLHNEISLDLNLCCSGSSSRCQTKFVAPNTIGSSGSSPVDICLGFNGNNCSSTGTKAPENETPKVDLELSLSTGGADSDVTSVGVGTLTLSSIHQLVDEGSTSSKWKRGALVALVDSLQATKTCNSNQVDSLEATKVDDINPITPHFTFPTVPAEPVTIEDQGTVPQNQPRRTAIKTCQFPGCHKGARGASGRCISHGGGRRCQKPGCQKGAEGKTVFCKAHGGGRRCEQLGCTKSAEGRTNLCIAHGGGRRCTYSGGCNHAARGKTGLCIRHGGGKRCKVENCTKSAEGLSGLCIGHGGGPRCQFPQCSKGAQGSTKFCKAHGGGKRCTFIGCTKGAEGSTLFCKGHGGGKRCSYEGGGVCTKSVHGGTLYCVAHGGGKRCTAPGCTKSARGRTDFCVRHGGGKRCKHEGCGKSAQGSTDFCKAHGGGKRCLWGQLGSGFGEDDSSHCDKYARGKIGLCAAHNALIQDKRVHGNGIAGLEMKDIANQTLLPDPSNNATQEVFPFEGFAHDSLLTRLTLPGEGSSPASLHEGRVHGGSLMSMLKRS